MRIKLLYVLLIISSIVPIYGQGVWIFDDYNLSKDNRVVHLENLDDNKFVSVSFVYGDELVNVLRIQDVHTGEVLHRAEYLNDSLRTLMEWIIVDKEKKEILVFGKAGKSKESLRRYFSISKWDFELNLKEEIFYPLPQNQKIISTTMVKKLEKEYIFMGISARITTGTHEQALAIKLDEDCNLKLMKNIRIYVPKYIDRNIDGDGYVGIGPNSYVFDSLFNVIDYQVLEEFGGGGLATSGKILDDSTYLLGMPHLSDSYGVRVAKINKDFSVRKQDYYEREEYGFVTLGVKCFDWFYKDALYLSGFNFYTGKYFDVTKYNLDLEILWRKHLSLSEDDFYAIESILATPDGGCIVVGQKQVKNPEGKRDRRRAFMLKFDSDGNTVSTQEPSLSSWSITVYPNPSEGGFNIEVDGEVIDARLRLYDMQGREVSNFDNLNTGLNQLDMYNVPKGIYVWHLEKKGEVIGTGKWEKVR